MPDNRRTIPPSALLELGDINGLLHELNGQQPVDNTRPKTDGNEQNGSGTANEDKKAKRQKQDKKDNGQNSSSTAKSKQAFPKVNDVNKVCVNPSSSSSSSTGKGSKASSDAWEQILTIYSGYNHTVNRKDDSVIWIEKDIITTLQSCLGQESGKIVNSILLWFIGTYKSRLREMQSSRSPLL